jgi:hypothetical protein
MSSTTPTTLDSINFTGGYPVAKDFAPSVLFTILVRPPIWD